MNEANPGKGQENQKVINPVVEVGNGLRWRALSDFRNLIELTYYIGDGDDKPSITAEHTKFEPIPSHDLIDRRIATWQEIVKFAIAAKKTLPDSSFTAGLRSIAHKKLSEKEQEVQELRDELFLAEEIDLHAIRNFGSNE